MGCRFCEKVVERPYFSERLHGTCMACQAFINHRKEIKNILIDGDMDRSDELDSLIRFWEEERAHRDHVPL